MTGMEFLDIAIPMGALALSLVGLWYKINYDTKKSISEAIAKVDEKAMAEVGKLRNDISGVKSDMVNRHEYERDNARMSSDVKAFRDEVREDIRTLNTSLTTRLDLMMQKVLDFRITGSGPK